MPLGSTKPKFTRAELKAKREELSAKRSAAGKRGGIAKAQKEGRRGRGPSLATLEKEIVRTQLEQRFMRVVPQLANAQISIATGQQFLYKIEKERVEGPKGGVRYINKKPELVTSQWEIEQYLEELAENNGDISDEHDPAATYYYLTTKEPNNEALKDIQNRLLGKPKETVDVNQTVQFSLSSLAQTRTMLDGNKDLTLLDAPRLDAPEE